MKIYTKTGDNGTTGLFGGKRASKASTRIETYGTVDELNTIIGIVIAEDPPARMKADLTMISNMLFKLGTDLAAPHSEKLQVDRIDDVNIMFIEQLIDEYTQHLPPLRTFILPGGTRPAAFLHQARTVCRRAERLSVRLGAEEQIGGAPQKFLNRLSDYLFTAARYVNHLAGKGDIEYSRE